MWQMMNMQIRVEPKLLKPLKARAKANRRSTTAEANELMTIAMSTDPKAIQQQASK